MELLFDNFRRKTKLISIIIRIAIAILGAVLIIQSANFMLSNKLWGYHPLSFFIGWWLIFNLLFGLWKGNTSSWKWWLLSSTSGILFYIGFPDPSVTPAIFLAFVPLLWIIEEGIKRNKSQWFALKYCYSAFLLWNILSTFWVANTSFVPSIVAFTLNAVFMTIPVWGYIAFRKRFSLSLSMIALVAFWISFEIKTN